jgi:glycosyltransferase involved in cell wall biosynthesis
MLVTNRGFDDPRVCMEAEALADAGYCVSVVGWDRDIDHDTDRTQNGVRFLGLKLRSTHGRGIMQPLFLSGFWWRAWRVLQGLRPAIIHCHDLDTLPLGLAAARSMRARLVFDAHENFPDMMTGHLPRPAVSALRWLERHLVPRCDAVITVGERLADHYRKLGGRKVTVVGNWKDPADFRFSPEVIRRTRKELGLPDGVIAICFIANLGRERHLEPLLSAVVGDPRFACVVGGEGIQAATARQYTKENSNIFYLGRVSPERIPLITAACDVVYYGFDKTNPNARWSAPNKLYEAIAAGKPILAGDFGEIGDTVRSSGCGIITDTATASGVIEALNQLASESTLRATGDRAPSVAARGLCRDEASRRIVHCYAELARMNGE